MAQDLRDIRGPVPFPADPWWFVLGGVLLSSLLSGAWLYYKRRPKPVKQPEPAIQLFPWEIALEELNKLKQDDLIAARQFDEFYSRLSNIVRRYFENQFHFRAPEMTTEEFLYFLKDSPKLSEDQKDVFKEFLEHSDMVKFAKYEPKAEDAENAWEFTRNIVEETKG